MLKVQNEWVQAFEEYFWPAYRPLRAGYPNPKAAALKAWAKIAPSQETLDAIMDELEACMVGWAERSEPQFIPHASTWLNARIFKGRFVASEGASK